MPSNDALDKFRDEFDTSRLLDAIDFLDTIRSIVAGDPPQLREDLLRLHDLTDRIANQGEDLPEDGDENPFFLADEIESQISEIQEAADSVGEILSELMQLLPGDDGLEDEDEEDI